MGCGLVPWASVLCELNKPDPCQAHACEIQKCLQAHNYQEESCQSVLRQMERCCEKWKDQSGSCSGFHPKKKVAIDDSSTDTRIKNTITS